MDIKFINEVKKIVSFTEQHFRENIGVEDCAKRLGYTPRYCNRMFKNYFGETIGSRLRSLRMQAAKEDLLRLRSVEATARGLSFSSPDGFSRAFRREFGITPTEYLNGEKTKERYAAVFDYTISYGDWMKGENPSHGGVWEYGYYDPETRQYAKMNWNGSRFEAPFEAQSKADPAWYCRNRSYGYGMHPGKTVRAVRTFLCPYGGEVEVFFSAGRMGKVKSPGSPCALRLYHGQTQVFPKDGAVVLQDVSAAFLTARLSVRKGDRISLHLESLGDIHGNGIVLYRQRVRYTATNQSQFDEINKRGV